MDDDARRLVDDEQVLVLVCDPEVHRLGLERRLGPLGKLDLDLLPALEAKALRADLTVDPYSSCSDESLSLRTRLDGRKPGEKAVEPEPGRVVRNA
jgi:hypothetical protein